MALTVTALARRFGLSRTALLHYDRVGLLRPSQRTLAGARLYDERDVTKLEAISRYRRVGVPLARIKTLLETGDTADVLTARLVQLDAEVAALEEQRRIVRALLGGGDASKPVRLDKKGWVAILRGAGLDDAAMMRWHREFEARAPEAHRAFLSSLGLPAREVARIRKLSVARQLSSSPAPAAERATRASVRASASRTSRRPRASRPNR
ncbi:MAG: MerR family transcriptional regulator [Archangium sp.]